MLETIEVVEDEPAIRGLMATALERAGYRVIQARNGQEALDLFDGTVDLVVTDMRMPYVAGQALIDTLRERRRTLKVVAISGYPGSAPDDPDIPFLAKPFSRDQLLDAVREVLTSGDVG